MQHDGHPAHHGGPPGQHSGQDPNGWQTVQRSQNDGNLGHDNQAGLGQEGTGGVQQEQTGSGSDQYQGVPTHNSYSALAAQAAAVDKEL